MNRGSKHRINVADVRHLPLPAKSGKRDCFSELIPLSDLTSQLKGKPQDLLVAGC